MADAVSITKLQDGPKKAAFYLTNLSDGTGESAVKKIDMSTLATNAEGTAVTSVSISKVTFSTVGMSVTLLYDATTNVVALGLPADYSDTIDLSDQVNGLPNYAGTGVTGDILLTTVGHTSGDTYSIVIEVIKKY
jgi:hypothetical protein|tara:strand:- start:1113 stop:1517 length:405 start_codon:yes stop_codon:yes gene_type:complete